jgi:hypothetical protein
MKKQFNISQKWRKITIMLLLINFLFVPLMAAFPTGECNGVCEMGTTIHECSSHENEVVQKSCCDTMDLNPSNNTSPIAPCGMELSDIDCALVYHSQINTTYIIPKIIDVKIEFTHFSTIYFEDENSDVELFELTQNFSERTKPPIYLTNLVFLI